MKMSIWSLACQQSVFQRYHSEYHLSEFYPQDGGESQLASKLRHCHPSVCESFWWTSKDTYETSAHNLLHGRKRHWHTAMRCAAVLWRIMNRAAYETRYRKKHAVLCAWWMSRLLSRAMIECAHLTRFKASPSYCLTRPPRFMHMQQWTCVMCINCRIDQHLIPFN